MRLKTLPEFYREAWLTHNGYYDYSKVVYVNRRVKVEILCPKHGSFYQLPRNHTSGQGCSACAKNKKYNNKSFIAKASQVHNNKYSYSFTFYKSAHQKVEITCGKHGNFKQIAHDHLNGSGCIRCANTGFDPNKQALLYYLRIERGGVVAYKIGITNRTITQRYKQYELPFIKVLSTLHHQLGFEALKEEQKILIEFASVLYKGPALLSSGNTELFTEDVLNLDNERRL